MSEAAQHLIATLGLSFIIQQLVLMTWGGRPRGSSPRRVTVDLFGVVFPGYRLVAGGLGLVLGLLWLVVYKTSW